MKIEKNAVVSLTYALNDASGALIEQANDPISYLHGGFDGIFPAVEEVLHGKDVGDKFTVSMTPDEAFGEYEHDLVRVEPREMFPAEVAV
ncbi:MAG: peptidylprolyl isomerase, partial [Sideroxydans sp.]|nr:peptidylprolyl isomerase [Sideroxydans sp.]